MREYVYTLSINNLLCLLLLYMLFAFQIDVLNIMDEMKDVNWQWDIRQMVEDLVREKKRQTLLAEARELRKGTKNIGISASELIREDRDASVIGRNGLANA